MPNKTSLYDVRYKTVRVYFNGTKLANTTVGLNIKDGVTTTILDQNFEKMHFTQRPASYPFKYEQNAAYITNVVNDKYIKRSPYGAWTIQVSKETLANLEA